MALWAIKFGEFDIQYRPCTTIKGQVIADVIAKFTNEEDKGADNGLQWSIHIDRSSNRQVGGVGVMFLSPEGNQIECMVRLNFPTTNNEAEYETLVAELDLTKAAGATSVVLYYDSQVVTIQVNRDYKCKGKRMKRYLDQVRRRVDELKGKIIQIPGGENEQTDCLAKAASAEHMTTLDNVLSFVQFSPLIDFVDV